ncbi:MAG: hypothetical protein R2788_18975 [Saprospiraceae bacterium]
MSVVKSSATGSLLFHPNLTVCLTALGPHWAEGDCWRQHTFWVVLGETIGVSWILASFLMANDTFKKLSDQYDSITIPDYLVSHFKTKNNTLRIIASVA